METKKNKTQNNEKIILTWTEKEYRSTGRCGAMYCFKMCDINRN